jgi:nucleoside-diphosphate-sugar epimerase
MNKKQISILACGWLGLPLAKSFVEKGFRVKGSTTSLEKMDLLDKSGIEAVLLDLSNSTSEAYQKLLSSSDILIINIPPGRPIVPGKYAKYMSQILLHIPKHTKVIFVSSTSVYSNTNTWVDETQELNPNGSGSEIIAAENCLKNVLKERLSIIRFAGLIGYDRIPGRFLANKKNLKNGNGPVNLIHRDDCIALIHSMLSKELWNEIINGVADEHPLRKDFYAKAAEKLGLSKPTFEKNELQEYKIVSNEKGKKLLDFTYQFPDPYRVL